MKLQNRFKNIFEGLSKAFGRFPLTAVFLIAVTVLDGMMIQDFDFEFERHIATLAVGAFISIVFQMAYERFCVRSIARVIFMIFTLILTFGYYMIVMNAPEFSEEITIKTTVVIFGLIIGFLWVPTIRSRISFNESFMSGFKAFFISLFFSGVIMAGLSMIYGATDQLLFDVPDKIYPHTANIVFVLFATMYFLSLTPGYPGSRDLASEDELKSIEEEVSRFSFCPKYLEILISYIIVPLSMVFTIILLLYIVRNIGGSFWKDDLLEPMLVTYIIVVILLYILASRLENRFAVLFRKIFPKVLLPIVLFQTVNSFLRMGSFGLTHGRYYVILFGIFAFISGLVFTFKPVEKNGIVPMVLIICIAVSVVPPVDAFTISRASQVRMLENVLINNDMLKDGDIVKKEDIDDDSREKITETLRYLYRMNYIEDIEWLPEDFEYYNDFEEVFGFSQYAKPDRGGDYIYIRTDMDEMIDIGGYDYLINTYLSFSDNGKDGFEDHEFTKDGKPYRLERVSSNDEVKIAVYEGHHELVSLSGSDIISRFEKYYTSRDTISLQEAQVVSENDRAAIRVIVQYLDVYQGDGQYRFNADIYLLVKIK